MSYNYDRKNYNILLIITDKDDRLMYVYACKTFDAYGRLSAKYENNFYNVIPIDIRLQPNVKIYNEKVDVVYDYKDF